MEFAAILGIIQGATNAVRQGRAFIEAHRGVLSETDEGKLKDALAQLQQENDAMYQSTIKRLDEMAAQGGGAPAAGVAQPQGGATPGQ